MNINTFIEIANDLPPHIAVLIRGGTGIGKSAIVKQIADRVDKPMIDVRGSTMSEGDTGGYPDIESMKETGVMSFCMPAWFVRACNEPVILFLDEMNRSLPAVQQSFFQIILDRQLGNDKNGMPYNIHPETRVFAAVNHGSEYDVNEIDPALLRRFWTVDIKADIDNWINWAIGNNINDLIIEFLKTRVTNFAPEPSSFEPGDVFPTPASWTRLDETLKFKNISLLELGKTNKPLLFNIASGFVGIPAAIEFSDYIEKYEFNITPEDVLNKYDSIKRKLEKLSNDRLNLLIERIAEHGRTNDWTVSQAKNAANFGKSISEEMLIHMWSKVSETKNIKTIQNFHKYIGQQIVKVVNTNKNLLNK